MKTLQLTKQSSKNEIKEYFNAVQKLTESADEFPVNLSEVWMLVYVEKGKAMRALKENFIEGVDYHLAQNGKVVKSNELINGIVYDAKLSVSCLEYFIARKNRSVFEVYRQVFHHATKPLSQLDILAQSVQILQAQEKRIAEIDDRVKVIEAKTTTRPDYFTIVGYATLHKIQCGLSLACRLGRKAAVICKNRGIETEEIPDPRFGKVKTYPEEILKEVFEIPIN